MPIANNDQHASQLADPLPSLQYPLSDHFLSPDQSPFNATFLCRDMSDRPLPTGFRARFQSAVQEYARQTGIDLVNHPLAQQLENCDSYESVVNVLQNLLKDPTASRASVSSGLQAFSVSRSRAEFSNFSQVCLGRKAFCVNDAYSTVISTFKSTAGWYRDPSRCTSFFGSYVPYPCDT